MNEAPPFLGQCWDTIVILIADAIRRGETVRIEFPMGLLICEDGVPNFRVNQTLERAKDNLASQGNASAEYT